MVLKSDIINLSNEREVNNMEEKRNYVVYVSDGFCGHNDTERVVKMTEIQAKAIEWFIDACGIDGTIELAENYNGEEI
jgi:hypothetical protein